MARLPPQARRLRTVIITAPIIAATSFVLYKRLVLDEPQRKVPRDIPAPTKNEASVLSHNSELQHDSTTGSETL